MVNLAYTISIHLKDALNSIENLRQHIILTPLSPKQELRVRWEAIVARIYWSASLDGSSLTKSDIATLLTQQAKAGVRGDRLAALDYKKASDYLSSEWLVNARPVTPAVIRGIHDLACAHSTEKGTKRIFQTLEGSVKQLLDYLQTQEDHPIIQSAIAHLQLRVLSPFGSQTPKVARLVTYLFLYKHGYDCRGLWVLEQFWRRDLTSYQQAIASFRKDNNANQWLDYFVRGVLAHLENIAGEMRTRTYHVDVASSFFELNDRQKGILVKLEHPEVSITNKKVQRSFGVSQITASRDLARLAALGLIYPHGKGRSVYYTRV